MNFSRYIGIPYKTGGRILSDGLDCYGICKVIFKEVKGIDLPDYTDLVYDVRKFYREGGNHILNNIDNFQKDSGFFTVSSPFQIFDLLVFLNEHGSADHIGVYIDDDKFIHTSEASMSMIGRLEGYWNNKLHIALRYKE